MFAHGAGNRTFGAILIGFVVGVLTLAFGRVLLGGTRSAIVRTLILAVFAGPAGVAGFGIARDIARLTSAKDTRGIAVGAAGAAMTMAAALARFPADPEGTRLGVCASAGPLVAHRRQIRVPAIEGEKAGGRSRRWL